MVPYERVGTKDCALKLEGRASLFKRISQGQGGSTYKPQLVVMQG
jgi:hypothetical protein